HSDGGEGELGMNDVTPPAVDPRDPVSDAIWRQWVTDSIAWMKEQVGHVHECIEKRISETKQILVEGQVQAEEAMESRHQQELAVLERVDASVQVFTAFMENAKAGDIAKQAVQVERQRVKTEAQRRRERIIHGALDLAKLAVGAGILTAA